MSTRQCAQTSERDAVQAGLQSPHFVAQCRIRAADRDPRRDLLHGQRCDGTRGDAPLPVPCLQLRAAARIDDGAQPHPRVRGRAHRAMLSGCVHGRACPLLHGEVLRRPPGDREFGVLCLVAAGHPIAIGEQLCPVRVDEDGAERLVAGVQGFTRQVHAGPTETAVILGEVRLLCHALHPIITGAPLWPGPSPGVQCSGRSDRTASEGEDLPQHVVPGGGFVVHLVAHTRVDAGPHIGMAARMQTVRNVVGALAVVRDRVLVPGEDEHGKGRGQARIELLAVGSVVELDEAWRKRTLIGAPKLLKGSRPWSATTSSSSATQAVGPASSPKRSVKPAKSGPTTASGAGAVRSSLRASAARVSRSSVCSLTMAAQVVAIEFQTVAAANNYWRG